MRTPRLGDRVYWVEHERPPGKDAAVSVRSGRYLAREGARAAVDTSDTDPARPVTYLPEGVPYFADRADADTFAFGTACRLLANFRYESVRVAGTNGESVVTASDSFRPLVST